MGRNFDVRPYLRAKFALGGRDLTTGVDCYGLVCAFYAREYDIKLPTYDEYVDLEEARITLQADKETWSLVEGTPAIGDVAVMWEHDPEYASHVAIYLGNRLLTTMEKRHVLLLPLDNTPLGKFTKGRVIEYRRHIGTSCSAA